MSTLIGPAGPQVRSGRRERRAERKRLRRHGELAARLAELHAISALLDASAEVVRAGWVQGAWFTVSTPGGTRDVTAYDLKSAVDRPVSGACLVGAVVQAAGGPASVRSQLVQRTLDLVWHVLREDPDRPVRWCPGPRARLMAVLELTRWNDAAERTQDEVADLLVVARQAAGRQRELCHADRAALDGAYAS